VVVHPWTVAPPRWHTQKRGKKKGGEAEQLIKNSRLSLAQAPASEGGRSITQITLLKVESDACGGGKEQGSMFEGAKQKGVEDANQPGTIQ